MLKKLLIIFSLSSIIASSVIITKECLKPLPVHNRYISASLESVTSPASFNIDKIPAVFHIKVDNNRHCTAFAISDVYALTATHCILINGKDSDIDATDFTGNTIDNVEVVSYEASTDLALLKGDFKTFNQLTVEVNEAEAAYSEQLMTCGFPRGSKHLLCTPFIVMGPNAFMVAGTRNAIYPGMSGGPVINMETNHVVGINHQQVGTISYIAPTVAAWSVLGIEP